MNNYIVYLQDFNSLFNKLRNAIDERESLLYRINMRSLSTSLNEFEQANGPQLLVTLRVLTLNIIKCFKKFSKYLVEENCSSYPFKIQHSCYLCKVLRYDETMLTKTSVVLSRLSYFVHDFITFIPKNKEKAMQDIQDQIKSSFKKSFSLSEISQFERIAQKLSFYNSQEVERSMVYLISHKCRGNGNYQEQTD